MLSHVGQVASVGRVSLRLSGSESCGTDSSKTDRDVGSTDGELYRWINILQSSTCGPSTIRPPGVLEKSQP
jgi:hypothetical protein